MRSVHDYIFQLCTSFYVDLNLTCASVYARDLYYMGNFRRALVVNKYCKKMKNINCSVNKMNINYLKQSRFLYLLESHQ